MTVLEIRPLTAPPDAAIRLPGSRSLTNRALVCAALADGRSMIQDALWSDDTRYMVEGLRALGVRVEPAGDALLVDGEDGTLPAPAARIYAGDAGTVARFLTAVACLGEGRCVVDGSERMRARPIGDLVAALRQLGGEVDAPTGCPPVTIAGRGLPGGRAVLRGEASSQYLSALLLVAPYAAGDVEIMVEGDLPSRPFVDMTIAVMAAFGVAADRDGYGRFSVRSGQRYRPRSFAVEPDATAAANFFAAAAATGGRVTVPGLTRASAQGDVRFVEILGAMGCGVEYHPEGIAVRGPETLRGGEFDMREISDTSLALAAIAPFCTGPAQIRNVAHIRTQETDRITALAAELRRIGQAVEEHRDGLRISPRPVRPAEIETHGDHRMAMAFAVTGLRAPGIRIRDPGVVSKTFPDYFERLERLRQ